MQNKFFKTNNGKIALPVFFPDATKAVVRAVDSQDIKNTKTPGILVNTYHLFKAPGKRVIKKFGGVGNFMDWDGGLISDSGGFQVMSLAKSGSLKGKVTDDGVMFREVGGKKTMLTPEESIAFQMELKTDMVIVLDDFTEVGSDFDKAKISVERTLHWAQRSKAEFSRQCKIRKLSESRRPYILGVVQGGYHYDLRKYCADGLVTIGFDGLGYGGLPVDKQGVFNYEAVKWVTAFTPSDYLLYGLGIGKPHEIVACVDMGYQIFDCVLPTRDARHKRLYVYTADSIDKIDVRKPDFYSYYTPDKEKYYSDNLPVSTACDCLLCTNYTRSYLAHLFRIKDVTALRLATIHNLRFYALLMEKLQSSHPLGR